MPPERPPQARRKAPQQRRSRSTVESIKQAALLLLGEGGIALCTTDRIAERAGVSIGSLYQYFPNRDAILTTLYEDVSIEYAGKLKATVPVVLNLPTAEAVVRIVTLLLHLHEHHGLILLKLVHEAPQLRLAEQPFSIHRLVSASTRAYLAGHLGVQSPADLERMAFFMEHVVLGSIDAFLRNPPPSLSRKAFLRDLQAIATHYMDSCTTTG